MSDGYCLCGCGGKTTVADWTDKKGRHKNGEHRKYLKGHYAKHMQSTSGPDYRILENECWEWMKGRSHGYGVVNRGGRKKQAHVWYWENRNGPLPKGLDPHHNCLNKLCVNPDHIILLTRSEHVRIHRRLKEAE